MTDDEANAAMVTLRPYRDPDAEALALTYRCAVRSAGARDHDAYQVEAWAALVPSAADYQRRAADGRSVWIAAGAKDRPLASADLEPDGHIDHFHCLPEAMGRGIGTALVLTLEAVAHSRALRNSFRRGERDSAPAFRATGLDGEGASRNRKGRRCAARLCHDAHASPAPARKRTDRSDAGDDEGLC